ncbi:MAG: DUF4157 domain-containing protein [Flavobacteriaceae bacterium]|nr:DUF4157 domain-containing protein [Flavobacteriaceae bacterium]
MLLPSYENKNVTKVAGKSFIGPTPTLQKKLKVGSPNDPLEAEADAVADKVVRQMEFAPPPPSNNGSLVQRKCSNCEEEELQKKPIADTITPIVQRRALNTEASGSVSESISTQINASRGRGNKMDAGTLSAMESGFGTDFSNVRIHTDSNAIQLSKSLQAQAFTVGNDIYFNEGKYNPSSSSGKHLLAHELTHTVQQSGSVQAKLIQRTPISEFNESHPNVLDTILDVSRGIEEYALGQMNYNNSSLRNRTDVIEHLDGTVTHRFDLGVVNLQFRRTYAQFLAKTRSILDNRSSGRVEESDLHDWVRIVRTLMHDIRILTLAYALYPLYRRPMYSNMPVGYSLINSRFHQIASSSFFTTHGAQVLQEQREERVRREREQAQPTAIQFIIRYYRRNRSHIEALSGPGPGAGVHATVVANKLVEDFGLNSEQITAIFTRLRTGDPDRFHHLLFHNRLISELENRGIENIASFREEFSGTGYSVIQGLAGEFNEDPDAVAITSDTIISLIPILDQISDARDIIAHIYFLSDNNRREYANPLRWLGLVFTVIGVVPEVGSALKGLSKFLMRGVRRHGRRMVTRVIGHSLNFLERLFPRAIDGVEAVYGIVRRNWNSFVRSGTGLWNQIMEQGASILRRMMNVSAQRWALIRRMANRHMPSQFIAAREMITELLDALGEALARRGSAIADSASRGVAAALEIGRRIRDRIRRLTPTGRLMVADEAFERASQRLFDLERRLQEAMGEGSDEAIEAITREMDEISEELTEQLNRIEGRRASDLENAEEVGDTATTTTARSADSDPSTGSGNTGTRRSADETAEPNRLLDLDEVSDEVRRARTDQIGLSSEPGYVIEFPTQNGQHTWRLGENGRWCRFSDPVCYVDYITNRALVGNLPAGRLAYHIRTRFAGKLRGPETEEALLDLCRLIMNNESPVTRFRALAELRSMERLLLQDDVVRVELLVERRFRGARTPDIAVQYRGRRSHASVTHEGRRIERVEVTTVYSSDPDISQDAIMSRVESAIRGKIRRDQLRRGIQGAQRITQEGGLVIEIGAGMIRPGMSLDDIAEGAIDRLLRREINEYISPARRIRGQGGRAVRFIEIRYEGAIRRYVRRRGGRLFQLVP